MVCEICVDNLHFGLVSVTMGVIVVYCGEELRKLVTSSIGSSNTAAKGGG